MLGVITLLLILYFLLFFTRIATIILVYTGLPENIARFQPRSAVTCCGFTTSESEQIAAHPVRRRVIAGPTLAAFWLWNIATRSVPLPLLNITQYLIPISAILFAHFILRENLSVWQCAGGVLIVVGVWLDPSVAGFLRCKASKNNSI